MLALALHIDLALCKACVLEGEACHIKLRLICWRKDNLFDGWFVFPYVSLCKSIHQDVIQVDAIAFAVQTVCHEWLVRRVGTN